MGRENVAYPVDEPQFSDEIVSFATKVIKGEIKPSPV